METSKEDYIRYRILKSQESLNDATLLSQNGRWNASVNRLYYSCFFIVNALLYKSNLRAKTHNGVKTLFYNEFVRTHKVKMERAKIFPRLFNWREESDYVDFSDFTEETVIPLIQEVEEFNKEILALIESI